METKGMSPTIATVLLVAIAIAFIVIAYFWVAGIQSKTISRGGQEIEKAQNPDRIEIQSALLNSAGTRIQVLFVKNAGDYDMTSVSIFVKGQLACSGHEVLKGATVPFNSSNCSGFADIDVSDKSSANITVTSKNGKQTVNLATIIRTF